MHERSQGTRRAIVREKKFGSVIPVIPYNDVDDQVMSANATKLGLVSGVWIKVLGALHKNLEKCQLA